MYFLVILHSYKNKILASIAIMTMLLSPPSQTVEQISSSEPLKIILSAEHQSNPQNLLFELDNMDVTRLVSFENNTVWIHPATLLNQGNHSVKVYQLLNNELQLLKQYDFNIITQQIPAITSAEEAIVTETDKPASISSNISIDNSINASMTFLTSDYDLSSQQRWSLDGSSNINAEWKRADWSFNSEINLFLDKNNPADHQPIINLDDYVIKVRKGQLSSQIGHHKTEESSLILQNFHRRGISMNWTSATQDKRFTSFVFNNNRIAGFRDGLGVGNKDSRVFGGILTIQPFEKYKHTELSVTWLTGKNKQDSTMVDEQGKAWGIALKSKHFDDRLNVQSEFARSRFNDGMSSMGITAEEDGFKTDTAYRTSIEYQAIPESKGDEQNKHSLVFSWDNRYIGATFYSLANLGLGNNLHSQRFSAHYKRGSISLHTSVEQQRDNVNNDPQQATVESLQLETSIDFSPKNTKALIKRFWGVPHFSLQLSSSQEDSISLPMEATAMDKQVQRAALSADFSHEKWDWNGTFSYHKLKEETGHVETTHSQTLDFSINRQLSDSSQVSGQWQINKQRALGMDDITKRLVIINASTELIPKKLTAKGSLTLSHQEQGWESINIRTSTLEFGLNYSPQSTEENKFKHNFWLKGQYHIQDDKFNVMENRESYQLSTGFSTTF